MVFIRPFYDSSAVEFYLARLNFLHYRVPQLKLHDGPNVIVGISSIRKMTNVSNYTFSRNFSGGI